MFLVVHVQGRQNVLQQTSLIFRHLCFVLPIRKRHEVLQLLKRKFKQKKYLEKTWILFKRHIYKIF